MNEIKLVDACKNGDNTARKKLYELYAQRMMGICFRYTADAEISQDLLHDGFIKVFESIHSFQYKGENSLCAWMSKIFTNTALEYLRKSNARKNVVALDERLQVEMIEDEKETDRIPDAVLMNFISELPAGYRTVFNLYTFEEMSHKEIGKILGINESSSRSQLARAKLILAKKINDYIKLNEG
ncbi:MAG: sigma-70 family RNA polymerase sigma factor [Candidatus Azobacteroides sp.]|nr:sigma-70 family RNA polymerase sigma factor [Candidatus Azobacteroides sp.]